MSKLDHNQLKWANNAKFEFLDGSNYIVETIKTMTSNSVPSKIFELHPILQISQKLKKFLCQNNSFKAENCLN